MDDQPLASRPPHRTGLLASHWSSAAKFLPRKNAVDNPHLSKISGSVLSDAVHYNKLIDRLNGPLYTAFFRRRSVIGWHADAAACHPMLIVRLAIYASENAVDNTFLCFLTLKIFFLLFFFHQKFSAIKNPLKILPLNIKIINRSS